MKKATFITVSVFLFLLVALISYFKGCFNKIGISEVTPGAGIPGTIVEIRGHGFNDDPFLNTVTIGGDPMRVISGDSKALRAVLLRKFNSGTITVQNGSSTATSSTVVKRDGTTTRATPIADSDPELVEGKGYDVDKHYDMMANGVGQKILVVLAKPSDSDPQKGLAAGTTAQQIVTDNFPFINNYFLQASYGKTSVNLSVTPAWVTLSKTHDFYCWQKEDIDRAQADVDAKSLDPSASKDDIDDAQKKLEQAKDAVDQIQEPDFLYAEAFINAKATVPDFDTYTDYIVVVAGGFLRGGNSGKSDGFHAESTRLGLKFDIDFPNPKGIINISQGADWGRYAHELSHFFAIGDIYNESHGDGTFTEGNMEEFDLMGDHDKHPLYSGYNINKNMQYFDEGGLNRNTRVLEWRADPDKDVFVELTAHGTSVDPFNDDVKNVLQLKVSESLSYYAEVRQMADPASDYLFDANIFGTAAPTPWKGGVIMYKVAENNNQSNNNERYISMVPPFGLMQTNDQFTDVARTIKITVEQKTSDRPLKYLVHVQWGHLPSANPNGQFDLRITPWTAPPYETPDIWVNSIKNDVTMPVPKVIFKNHDPANETIPIGNGDDPWVGQENQVFARITNDGMQPTPEDVSVTFYIISPPGVGDNDNWTPFATVNVGVLNPGETRIVQANRPWRPAVGEHTCIDVRIAPMNGEITFDNNRAQENFSDFETGSSSPYQPVEFDFEARNPYNVPVVMDLVATNVPQKWFVAFDHGSVWLKGKQSKKVHVVIWTDRIPEWISKEREKSPRKPLINIEGFCNHFSDRTFSVGGISTLIAAVRNVKINIEPPSRNMQTGSPFRLQGVVVPPAEIVPLSIHITDPSGLLIMERTQTSATGAFNYQTFYKPPVKGKYKIQVLVLRGSLASEAESKVFDVEVQ